MPSRFFPSSNASFCLMLSQGPRIKIARFFLCSHIILLCRMLQGRACLYKWVQTITLNLLVCLVNSLWIRILLMYVCIHKCTGVHLRVPSVCNWEFVNKGIVDNSQSVTLATTYHTPYWHTPRLIKKRVGYTCCQQLWFGVDGLQSITSLKESTSGL